jgi:two-component system response regulator VicR
MKKRILVAEDNNDLADVMRFALLSCGYEVVLARDDIEVVERAIALQPDLIVMDILMPKMTGLQAALRLRQHCETKTIPILAATALTKPQNREECLAHGCDDHIDKPFSNKGLAAAVERLLQEH